MRSLVAQRHRRAAAASAACADGGSGSKADKPSLLLDLADPGTWPQHMRDSALLPPPSRATAGDCGSLTAAAAAAALRAAARNPAAALRGLEHHPQPAAGGGGVGPLMAAGRLAASRAAHLGHQQLQQHGCVPADLTGTSAAALAALAAATPPAPAAAAAAAASSGANGASASGGTKTGSKKKVVATDSSAAAVMAVDDGGGGAAGGEKAEGAGGKKTEKKRKKSALKDEEERQAEEAPSQQQGRREGEGEEPPKKKKKKKKHGAAAVEEAGLGATGMEVDEATAPKAKAKAEPGDKGKGNTEHSEVSVLTADGGAEEAGRSAAGGLEAGSSQRPAAAAVPASPLRGLKSQKLAGASTAGAPAPAAAAAATSTAAPDGEPPASSAAAAAATNRKPAPAPASGAAPATPAATARASTPALVTAASGGGTAADDGADMRGASVEQLLRWAVTPALAGRPLGLGGAAAAAAAAADAEGSAEGAEAEAGWAEGAVYLGGSLPAAALGGAVRMLRRLARDSRRAVLQPATTRLAMSQRAALLRCGREGAFVKAGQGGRGGAGRGGWACLVLAGAILGYAKQVRGLRVCTLLGYSCCCSRATSNKHQRPKHQTRQGPRAVLPRQQPGATGGAGGARAHRSDAGEGLGAAAWRPDWRAAVRRNDGGGGGDAVGSNAAALGGAGGPGGAGVSE
mgnify:CR=1 FL=1